MKAAATGMLPFAAGVYVLARWQQQHGEVWAGYLGAAAEAAMVGGLADWFAVTALFRHPLGLPIPHTAIIPKRKDALGRSLGDFVGENFLSPDVVRTSAARGRPSSARPAAGWPIRTRRTGSPGRRPAWPGPCSRCSATTRCRTCSAARSTAG